MSLTHSTDRLSHTPNRLSHTAQTSLCNQRTRYLSRTCSSHVERACFGLRSMPPAGLLPIECLISHRFFGGTSVATPAEESARTSARRSSPSQPVATCPPHSSPPPCAPPPAGTSCAARPGSSRKTTAQAGTAPSAARAHRPDVRGHSSNCAVQLIGWGRWRTRARGERHLPHPSQHAQVPAHAPPPPPPPPCPPAGPLPLLRAAVLRSSTCFSAPPPSAAFLVAACCANARPSGEEHSTAPPVPDRWVRTREQHGAEEVMEGTCARARAAHGGGLRRKRAERKQREEGKRVGKAQGAPWEADGAPAHRAVSAPCRSPEEIE